VATVAVVGSAGRTGRRVVARLLARGDAVRGLQRRAEASPAPGFTPIAGDALDPHAVAETLAGASLVYVLLGPSPGSPPDVCSRATALVIDVMEARGPARLVCQTGAMIGHPRARLAWMYRAMEATFPSLRAQLEERRTQERLVRESGLAFTIVRPPRLTDGPAGEVHAGEDLPIGMFSSVSREALARFLVDEAAGSAFEGRAVAVVGA
jgi:uncharacterized protein YbjT (DUF2867 family)